MPKHSAGLLLYRRKDREIEVFLVHPGGPLWANKDLGAWSVPKGEHSADEDPLDAARREFKEETGFPVDGEFVELGTVRQAGGKLLSAWALEGDCDPAKLSSNHCRMQWPPRSDRMIDFPEVDRGAWFTLGEARDHILLSQRPLLDRLQKELGSAHQP
ncbi:NUDIX hydrolase [Candidatus Sulfotelmatomonas gaucii]|uniref:NUDIX hydrolase n=1 Tax=Candidatus Sulfuritelmatomonas gaucii TaxID=2043161 RepID=A0A2N9L3I7_9BACT|nr:NUDIX hydrolase [Candidatus Sulfotelmatomonas gaucii]